MLRKVRYVLFFLQQGDFGELFGYDKFVTQRILADAAADIMKEPLSDGIVVGLVLFWC